MLLFVGKLSKLYGGDVVLSSVDLRIERREKVALVGRNGAGKTTLLKILTGQEEPDGGTVQWGRGASIGYLSQQANLDPYRTVLQEAEEARKHLVEMERRLAELESRLEEGDADDLEEYSMLQEHFASEGGYSVEKDLRVVLQRMGFEEREFDKPVGALSGGEATRLMLAKLLLEEPDLLILDEPTNHLDLEATEWLEGWLRGYHGAVLLVSHDRTFLQNVAQRVVELADGETKSYPGPFEKYLRLRAEDEARQAEVARRQQEEIAKMDEYVRRFMNSQRTAQARGRLKQMEKLQAVAVQAPKHDKQMAGGFGKAQRSGNIVLEAKGLGLQFGEERLFGDLDWTVGWGERWGVVGQNGAGKSSLIKALLGVIQPTEGTAKLGANVRVGYFSQDANTLDLELTPMLYLNYELGMEAGPARSLLARFLISGDDAMRPIKTLSGGERNKMQLAVLTALQPNLLVLDEPTNHLDMASREALAEVLKEFNGTLVLVSHDRWLLGQITDQTLDVRRQGPRQYPGNYEEYRAWRERGMPARPQPKKADVPKKVEAKSNAAAVGVLFREPGSDERPQPTLSPRELSKEIGRTERAVLDCETQIDRLETDLQKLERTMATPSPDDDLLGMSLRHQELRQLIDRHLADWEALSERLDELKAQQGSQPN